MEWDVDMSTSAVSKVSKTSSILKWNVVSSWCLCGSLPNFLYSSSKAVMWRWRCFNVDSYMMYLLVRLFICPVSSFNRKISLLTCTSLTWNFGRVSPSLRRKDINRAWAFGQSTPSWGIVAMTTVIRMPKIWSIFMYVIILTYDFGALEQTIVSSLTKWTRSAPDND